MRIIVILIFGGMLVAAPAAQAITSEFSVGLLIGEDTSPPTIPADVLATPVSPTEIVVTWSAASDNVLVTGYQVFRDSVQIATTTLTSFNDSGLTAATLYSYDVRAFDAAFNFSSSSVVSATTTPAVLATSTPTSTPPRVGGDSLLNRVVESVSDMVTEEPAEPAADQPVNENIGVPNVFNFLAVLEAGEVRLSWQNPDASYDAVRIVSNDQFYPRDEVDGYIVYEGTGESAIDSRLLTEGSRYYTAFVYDTMGDVSSGAIARVVGQFDDDNEKGVEPVVVTEREEFAPESFTWDDIEITQTGFRTDRDETVLLRPGVPFRVSIPYKAVPETLKTLTVTVRHPERPDETFSFLLRVNEAQTAYEAVVAGLSEAGQYPITVELFNFQTQSIATVKGLVVVGEVVESGAAGTVWFWPFFVALFLWGLYRLYWLFILDDEDNERSENVSADV